MPDFSLRINHVKYLLLLCLQKSILNFNLWGWGAFGVPVFEDPTVAKYNVQKFKFQNVYF